jgi:hypothetical protein
MSIELHIERLVIDETLLGGERGESIRAAIELELAGLLARPGAIDALRGVGAVTALPTVTLAQAGGTHDRLGTRIAMAVEHGLEITRATRAGGSHG